MAASSPPQTLNPFHLDDHDSSGQHHHLPPNSESTDGTQTREKRKRVDLDSEPEQQTPKENQEGEEEAPQDHQEKGDEAGKVQNHPMWKTSLCSYFRRSNGKCNHGETCRYAHGEEELRPRSDNTWDPTSERAKKMLKASSDDGETGKVSSGVSEAEEVMMTENVADGGEPALTKCFLNLPMKWTSDNLKNFLGEQALCFKSAKKKKGMIVGFVSFENADQVRRAIEELDGKSVGNKTLKIVEVIPRSFERKNKEGLPLSQCTQQSDAASATDSMHISESSSRMDDGITIDESLLRNSSVLRGRSARDVVSPLAHMPYVDQLEQKKINLAQTLKKLTRNARKACPNGVLLPEWIAKSREIGGLPCKLEGIVESPVVNGYRNKCEFSAGYSLQGKPTVGFLLGNFREGVTAVEEPLDCPNVSMTSCKYASIFQEFLQHSSLPIWNRLNNTGFWRQLTVREGRMPTKDTKVGNSDVKISEVMVMVQVCTAGYVDGVVNSELEKMAQAFAEGASTNSPSLPLTALVVQDHKGISNAAPADAPLRILPVPRAEGELELQATGDVGETRIHDYINNLRFCISPTAFFQVNTLAAERLYTLAGDWAALGPDTLLFDICCGTGTIGLTLAHRVGMVVGIEMNASAVSDAYRNAEINGIKNCRFVCAKAEDVMGLLLKEYLYVPKKQNETLNSSEKNNQNSPQPEEGGTCVDNACDSNESSVLMVANGEGTSICLKNGSQVENQHEESSMSENGIASIEQFKNVVAIVDPPRVGLHPTVIKALRTHPRLRRLVYVSCNPESLVANAIELCTPSVDKIEKGNKNNRGWRNMSSAGLARHRAKSMPNSEPFQPIKAMAVDLFPHTPHCESVLLLER